MFCQTACLEKALIEEKERNIIKENCADTHNNALEEKEKVLDIKEKNTRQGSINKWKKEKNKSKEAKINEKGFDVRQRQTTEVLNKQIFHFPVPAAVLPIWKVHTMK